MVARALTIAGSDSSGGAGIQADLKTFTVLGVFGMSALTALTAQNTCAVTGIQPVAGTFVRQQIDAVAADIGVDAAKTGMLLNAEIIDAVACAVREHRIAPLVVDPVMIAGTGATLLEPDAADALQRTLLPLAHLVTPNVAEAEALTGISISSVADMHRAARALLDRGAHAALVTGGHLGGADAIDVFDDGTTTREFAHPRLAVRHTHGTGCQFSAAITAHLARGRSLLEAVEQAKRFITVAITHGLAIGKGNGPANPMAWLNTLRIAD